MESLPPAARIALLLSAALCLQSSAQSLSDGLAAYWPLDEITGCSNRTPDKVHGYDLQPYRGGAHVLTTFGANTVYLTNGYRGNAMYFPVINPDANRCLLGYISPNTNNLVPINRASSSNLTVSFWVNAPSTLNDQRIWTDGNINNNNPGINVAATGSVVDMFIRQQPTAAELARGYGEFGQGHTLGVDTAFDGTWHNITLVQQDNGSGTTAIRTIYLDGVADGTAFPTKPLDPAGLANKWNVNCIAIGGWLRQTVPTFATVTDTFVDDVAMWIRALTPAEIAQYMANGITNDFPVAVPLQIISFKADLAAVVQGDPVVLSWTTSPDVAGLSIDLGVGPVLQLSACGVGSTSVTPSGTTTYTLTAIRDSETNTASFTVTTVNQVAPGWHFIDSFDLYGPGPLLDQGNWVSTVSGISGLHNLASVLSTGTDNQVLGLEGAHLLSGNLLGSHSITAGESNTLFLRFYLDPTINAANTNDGTLPDVEIVLGLSDKGLRDEQDFRASDNGPGIRIVRAATGGGGPIDLQAYNGAGTTTGFNYVDTHPAGIETGKVYTVWMDVYNATNDAGLNLSAYYSVYLQKEGEATRSNLFADFVADRQSNNPETLDKLFVCGANSTTPQGTNVVLFDDFYLSSGNGFNATVPVPASSFVPGAPPLRLSRFAYEATTSSFTLTWSAEVGKTYTLQKRPVVNSGSWINVLTGHPAGGATTPTVTFTDTNATGKATFYRISSP